MLESITLRGECGPFRKGHIPDFSGVNAEYLLQFPHQGLGIRVLSPISQAPVNVTLRLEERGAAIASIVEITIPVLSAIEGHNYFHGGPAVLPHEVSCIEPLVRVLLFKLGFNIDEIGVYLNSMQVIGLTAAWHIELQIASATDEESAPNSNAISTLTMWATEVGRPKWFEGRIGPFPKMLFSALTVKSKGQLNQFADWIRGHPRIELVADLESLRKAGIERTDQLTPKGISDLQAAVVASFDPVEVRRFGIKLHQIPYAVFPDGLQVITISEESALASIEYLRQGFEFLWDGVVPKLARAERTAWMKHWKGFFNYPDFFSVPIKPLKARAKQHREG